MEQYTVTGMSCAACSARVEKAVSKVPGVESCVVNLLTNSMGVEGSAPPQAVIAAVEEAGYGARLKAGERKAEKEEAGEALRDRETPALLKRLAVSLVFLAVLLYISMGHMMWGFPLPSFLAENHVAMGLLQLLLAGILMVINQRFFISGAKALWHRAPNMDTLVALGAGAAFGYSTYVLFVMTGAQAAGDMEKVMACMEELYFESAGTILTLITLGKMLEARSKGRTTNALKGLMSLAPRTAVVLREGVETEIPIGEVLVGDLFVVRPGEQIPVDGVVTEGSSAVNEAALTGESIPVDKEAGDQVSAATLNQSGFLTCKAVRVGEDTTLSQIIRMVSDAAATKAPIARTADKVSGIFVPAVIGIAAVTILVWLLVGEGVGFALARGISVLVISCPCALGLATPVAVMVGNGVGAGNGILFKTAVSLEETGKVKIVALDKTGTITKGEPVVTGLYPVEGVDERKLLEAASALEQKSEHPLAKAVLQKAGEEGIDPLPLQDFKALTGSGLQGVCEGSTLLGGNLSFIRQYAEISSESGQRAEEIAGRGQTPLFFAKDGKLMGIIAVADVLKEDGAEAVRELRDLGIRVVMLTGDNEKTARAIGSLAGVDEVIAGVLPDGKEAVIRSLQAQGRTAMVGDGINDAPALTAADVGIAIGAGTDIAIDAADVVLMKSRLKDVPAAIRLSRATLRNIHENLFWAFIYNIIGIPLAAGVWYPLWGWKLNPMFGAAAMSLSSFCVVTNALRLNWCRLYGSQKTKGEKPERNKIESKKENYKEKEKKSMEKTMVIEGMMCGHCEAAVKKALEEIPGVGEALVSHEQGTAQVTLTQDVADEVLRQAVEAKDYTVKEIR